MRAKKSLGQNFLTSRSIARDIVSAAAIQRDDVVVEIGPGKGMLTESLLATGAFVYAFEKDHRMIEVLNEKFREFVEDKKLIVIEEDILNVDLNKYNLQPHSFKIVANIPYYITGLIIKSFLSEKTQPESMTLLVQKEVADRIAREPKESILSISVKAFGIPAYIKTVPKRYFSPKPKVDSAILHIGHISQKYFEDIDEQRFFMLLKAGFAQKRKRLFSNLTKHTEKETLEKAFKNLGLDENVRAEELSVEQWQQLTKLCT